MCDEDAHPSENLQRGCCALQCGLDNAAEDAQDLREHRNWDNHCRLADLTYVQRISDYDINMGMFCKFTFTLQ